MPTEDRIDTIQQLPQEAVEPVKHITSEDVARASQILQKYKQGKAALDARIVNNQEWYRARHWGVLASSDESGVIPSSAWLFNVLANKHADAMDNYPSPNILPREQSDVGQAKALSSVIPCILDQDHFEDTYDAASWYKYENGAAAYAVYWDSSKLNGEGDISVRMIDILNLFWEPGVTDIERSANVFNLELRDNDELLRAYPQLEGKLATPTNEIAEYRHDDTIDTSEKSVVVDWYYKKQNAQGKTVLHLVKYCNEEVLYASEDDPTTAENGWYADGEYPFVFDVLFPLQGELCGFGYIDIAKSPQEYVDRMSQAILKNGLANAEPRYFIRATSGINPKEYLNYKNPLVNVEGNISSEAIMPIEGKPLSGAYLEVMQGKIDELKETTGTRDIATGGTTSGVTAASAIAAMQEAGSKLSRDANKGTYRAFRKIVVKIIERIRQFYDLPRYFRILGENGAMQFIEYSNAQIAAQGQQTEFGVALAQHVPLFDVEVTAEKRSPYSRMAQNELALQFYGQGFFDPARAEQARMCLEMMDFDRKDFILEKIAQNGTLYQLAMQFAQILDAEHGDFLAQQQLAQALGQAMPQMPQGAAQMPRGDAAGSVGEAANTRAARQRVADSTTPA